MVKQSKFEQAFSDARKKGLDKFQFNGNWYSTKTKEDTKTASHSGVNKIKTNQKTAKPVYDNSGRVAGGRNQNRLQIQKQGDLYALIDTETGQVFNSGKDPEALQQWANKNQNYLGEFTITAQRTKLNRKTPGYQPVDDSNLVDKQGDTRKFMNRNSGQTFVTDNYGNIVGDSFDPNAAKNDFQGWNIFTGSKRDMTRASSGKLKARSDMNEVNQKSKQAYDRITDDHERQMQGLQRTQGMANLAQSTLNMPNNIVTGALRTMRDDFTMKDYLSSFDVDNMYKGVNQSVGLGDLVGVENPYGRFAANLVNPMALTGVGAGSSKTVTQQKPIRFRSPSHEMGAYTYTTPGVRTVDSTKGWVVGGKNLIKDNMSGQGKMLTTKAKGKNYSALGKNNGQVTKKGVQGGIQSPKDVQFKYKGVQSSEPHIGTYPIEGEFSSYMPGVKTTHYNIGKPYLIDAVYNYTERPKMKYFDETPTATFEYNVEKPNKTVIDRITTGDFVPGSTGPNWNGTIGGGSVDVYNQKGYHSPIFGGVVAGPAKNNASKWYKPLGYHKNGGNL